MKYFINIENDFIIGVEISEYGINEITKERFYELLDIFKTKPESKEEGYDYKLKTDLTWELVELPSKLETDEKIEKMPENEGMIVY